MRGAEIHYGRAYFVFKENEKVKVLNDFYEKGSKKGTVVDSRSYITSYRLCSWVSEYLIRFENEKEEWINRRTLRHLDRPYNFKYIKK